MARAGGGNFCVACGSGQWGSHYAAATIAERRNITLRKPCAHPSGRKNKKQCRHDAGAKAVECEYFHGLAAFDSGNAVGGQTSDDGGGDGTGFDGASRRGKYGGKIAESEFHHWRERRSGAGRRLGRPRAGTTPGVAILDCAVCLWLDAARTGAKGGRKGEVRGSGEDADANRRAGVGARNHLRAE